MSAQRKEQSNTSVRGDKRPSQRMPLQKFNSLLRKLIAIQFSHYQGVNWRQTKAGFFHIPVKIFEISKPAIISLCVNTKMRPLEKHEKKESNSFFPFSCLNIQMRTSTYVGLRSEFTYLHEVISVECTNLPTISPFANLRKVYMQWERLKGLSGSKRALGSSSPSWWMQQGAELHAAQLVFLLQADHVYYMDLGI